MSDRDLSIRQVVTILVVPMSVVSLGIATFALMGRADTAAAAEQIQEASDENTRSGLSTYLNSISNDVANNLTSSLGSIAQTTAGQAAIRVESDVEALDQRAEALETKYEDLRELMEARGLPLRPVADYQPQEPSSPYPELTYDKSQEGYFYEFGEYLAGECTSCHKISYDFTGIPLVFGMDESHFVGRLNDYKSGKLTNETMASVARGLDDEMMLSLALFFKVQEPSDG